MSALFGYCDDSGRDSRHRALVLATVTLDPSSAFRFEERIWRWQADRLTFKGKEPKLRKLLDTAGFDYRAEKLEAWQSMLQGTEFRWFASLVPWGGRHKIRKRNVAADEIAGLTALNRFISILERNDQVGCLTLDRNIAEHRLPRRLLSAKRYGREPFRNAPSEGWRRLVGQMTYADSYRVPQIWIADAIAYLIHRKINQKAWRKEFDPIWNVVQQKVWLSREGMLSGWGLDVWPPDDLLEAEVTSFITGP